MAKHLEGLIHKALDLVNINNEYVIQSEEDLSNVQSILLFLLTSVSTACNAFFFAFIS